MFIELVISLNERDLCLAVFPELNCSAAAEAKGP